MRSVKDPIYGYMKIDIKYFALIDTAAFQRLRNIRQTGYQALYPSALHNRFVHSLGVFHLGKSAIACFYENAKDVFPPAIKQNWSKIEHTFLSACLLHDVGHSPFSHTGESYYPSVSAFRKDLTAAVGTDSFRLDIKSGSTGKPHEAMSALIGLDLCAQKKMEIDPEFFVRSIIGLKYSLKRTEDSDDADAPKAKKKQESQAQKIKAENEEILFKNTIISMLNGDLIDVDKLDYIARDSYVTGYNSLSIDVDRLLSGLTVCRDGEGDLCVAYRKKALSVIENVIYANDLERRWIQNNPVILYDCSLSDFAIRYYNSYMSQKYRTAEHPLTTVFIKDALTEAGLKNIGVPLRLLCDDDIISYIKIEDTTAIGAQLFSRNARLKPIWKTEASFDDMVAESLSEGIVTSLQKDLVAILDFLQNTETGFFLNTTALTAAQAALKEASALPKTAQKSYQRVIHICEMLKGFCKAYRLKDFEFAVVVASKFQSNYKKVQTNKIKIELAPKRVAPLDKMLSIKPDLVHGDNVTSLFYIYTTARNIAQQTDLGYVLMDYIRQKYQPSKNATV